jgi:hypothetical protein
LDCQFGSSVDGIIAGSCATRGCARTGTGRLCTTFSSLDLIPVYQRMFRLAPQVGTTIAVKRH